jgi:hypothetical protein
LVTDVTALVNENSRFLTSKKWVSKDFCRVTNSVNFTIVVADVDEVKADDVVAGVAASGVGLMQAVEVEAGCEDRPDAQNLNEKID